MTSLSQSEKFYPVCLLRTVLLFRPAFRVRAPKDTAEVRQLFLDVQWRAVSSSAGEMMFGESRFLANDVLMKVGSTDVT